MKIPYSDPYALAKGAVFLALSYLLLVHLLPGILGMWRESHTMNTLVVTPAMRAEVVASLADQASRHYLWAAKGKELADSVLQSERGGRYRLLTTPQQLAHALTTDMRAVTKDMHMRVEFSASEVPEVGDRGIDLPPNDDVALPYWLVDRLGRTLAKFGVDEVSQSEAGIGYIKLTRFFRPFLAGEKYAAAMKKVGNSRALIIDLRDTNGGDATSVALLASYFFDQPIHLSDIDAPRRHEREHMWTSANVEGPRYGSTRQVVILTSRDTFSAGEDFAYAMQTLQRATIIGEPTRGGAHPTERYRLARHFIARIPVAQSISPITHTNWEGNGVQPDIMSPAGSALRLATREILRKQLAAETDETRRARIRQWLAPSL